MPDTKSLAYLSKIKVLQLERDRGEWEGLAPDARREKESSLQMLGQLGHFHNIMSNETIGTLAFLTSEIKGIFVHPFLAERIISMLNYFLQHLVGPKMGALKVKDFSEFDFKPQQLVSDICTIYLNLGYVVNNSLWNYEINCNKKALSIILLVPYPLEKKYSGT
ncbi:ubiquitin conjugation factor E4 A-like [Sander vitreus]